MGIESRSPRLSEVSLHGNDAGLQHEKQGELQRDVVVKLEEGHAGNEAQNACDEAQVTLAEWADAAMEKVGGSGRFQQKFTGLMALPWVICGAQTMAHVLVTMPPHRQYVCTSHATNAHCVSGIDSAVPEASRVIAGNDCSFARAEYEYVDAGYSVISEFDLICESASYAPLLGTLFFFGFLVGVTVFGTLSDRLGRRSAFMASTLAMQCAAFCAAVSPSYATYAASRFGTGFGLGGVGLVAFVWNAELVGKDARVWLCASTNGAFAVGVLILSPLSYMLPAWRALSMVLFVGGLPLFFMRSCHESPKWLVSAKKDGAAAHRIFCAIADANGSEHPTAPRDAGTSGGQELAKGPSLIQQLCWDSRLSRRFVVMCISWFALSVGYYGLSMSVSNLGWSVRIANAISGMVELPMYALALWLVAQPWAGRRFASLSGLIVAGMCCLLSALTSYLAAPADGATVPKPGIFMLVLVFVGKAAVSMSFAVIYLYAAELFPTDVRSRSMSIQSLVARLGGMVSPIIASLGSNSLALPLTLFGLPCLVAGVLLLSLPETQGQPLPDTIEDVQPPGTFLHDCCSRRRYGQFDDERDVAGGQKPKPTCVGAID